MGFIESEVVELKSEVASDICKEVIAFANTQGGTLYIGVADNGKVVGVDDVDETILQLNHMIRDSIKPDITMFVHYETEEVNNQSIVKVVIQKGTDRPYYLGSKGLKPNGVYVRNGTSADPATDTAIRRMIKETDGDSFESMRSLEQKLTFEKAKEQFAKRNVAFDEQKMQTLGIISVDGMYSNVGFLLSDQCSHTIKAAVFKGTEKSEFQDRREFTGSLFQQMDDLYAYLSLKNQMKASFEGLYRSDRRDYPEEALREALLNSIVHRDYSFSASTLISIYDDRMEFVSVGGLPTGISLDDILLGLSVCRNQKLASVFYRLELIEAYGTGMPKIMHAYDDADVKPHIEVSNNAFKITLPNRNYGPASSVVSDMNKSSEEIILMHVIAKGSVVRSEVEALLNTSQATANRILSNMVNMGVLIKEGSGKNTRYVKKQ